jgi:hypothetical protein
MKLWPVSANFFREDDTFVAAFAFVHLRERVAGRQSPGHTHRISFSRGAHEAGAWGTGAFRSAGRLFSCQVCGRPRLRTYGTISEHTIGVKYDWRDLLDKRLPERAAALPGVLHLRLRLPILEQPTDVSSAMQDARDGRCLGRCARQSQRCPIRLLEREGSLASACSSALA